MEASSELAPLSLPVLTELRTTGIANTSSTNVIATTIISSRSEKPGSAVLEMVAGFSLLQSRASGALPRKAASPFPRCKLVLSSSILGSAYHLEKSTKGSYDGYLRFPANCMLFQTVIYGQVVLGIFGCILNDERRSRR